MERQCIRRRRQLLKRRSCLDCYEGWRSDSKESAYPEGFQMDIDHRRDNIDEPIWQKRGDSKENDVT